MVTIMGDKQTFGQRIRELRQRREWSQQELAEKVGVRQKQISAYERDINVPSGEIFIALADAFEVSLDYLAQRAEDQGPRANIGDLDLLERLQEIDKLSEADKELVKGVLDTFIVKSRFQRLAAGTG
ncbi:MAG: hypothetical protein AUK47_22645 [Deltaproteobacteria bacterium CG2_30_63_29]|nr:MAG: hypothetical protein AUK47_22645 [Deltaproteobacteria bacterium CG2_30_63_29]